MGRLGVWVALRADHFTTTTLQGGMAMPQHHSECDPVSETCTIGEAARRIGRLPNTVYGWSRKAKFPTVKIGTERHVRIVDVIAFAAQERTAGCPKGYKQSPEHIK